MKASLRREYLYYELKDIQKTKIMASRPISSGQIDGETVETVADFILAKLQDKKSIHRNHLHFYVLTMKNQKDKLRNISH